MNKLADEISDLILVEYIQMAISYLIQISLKNQNRMQA